MARFTPTNHGKAQSACGTICRRFSRFWLVGTVYAATPSRVCIIDTDSGDPKTNPNDYQGPNVAIAILLAPLPFTKPKGLSAFGPADPVWINPIPQLCHPKPSNPGPVNHRRGARWMPAMVHRTEPPAISIVGMDSGISVALWAINAIWDGSSAS